MSELFFTYEKSQFLLEGTFDEIANDSNPPKKFPLEDVYHSGDFKRPVYTSYNIAPPGLPEERKMLENLAPVAPKTGEPFTVRPYYWGGQMAIPTELVRMLAKFGPNDGETAAMIGTYADFMRAMRYNHFRRAELERVNKLINGTSTATRYAGRDGEPLFSTNHAVLGTGGTQSNLVVNMPLTEANVNSVISALSAQKDENGAPIDTNGRWTLVTGMALETQAWTLMNTEKKVGSAENDANRVYARRSKIDHVVSYEIPADYTGWWVFAENHGLMWKWMDKPYFDKESHLTNNSIAYGSNSGGRAFHTTWRGSFASLPS